jgi:hypothetical protein
LGLLVQLKLAVAADSDVWQWFGCNWKTINKTETRIIFVIITLLVK